MVEAAMGIGMNACMGIAQSQFSAFHERFRLLLRDHAIKAEPSQLISTDFKHQIGG